VSAFVAESKVKKMGAFCSDCLKSFTGSSGSSQYETISTDDHDVSRENPNTSVAVSNVSSSQQQKKENINVFSSLVLNYHHYFHRPHQGEKI
jgi:hypothetical protein